MRHGIGLSAVAARVRWSAIVVTVSAAPADGDDVVYLKLEEGDGFFTDPTEPIVTRPQNITVDVLYEPTTDFGWAGIRSLPSCHSFISVRQDAQT